MFTDHSTLKYLVNKPVLGGKIYRWLLLFQEYDFEIIVKPGRLNVGPDHLSRLELGEELISLEEVFKEFIHKFLEVYFDDWTIFGLMDKHVGALRLMLAKCREHQISLNLKKCIFCVPFGILLGHVVCRQGLMVDPAKIAIIVNLPPPTSVKQLHTMLGHT